VEGFALFERKLEGAQVKGQCEFGVKAVEAHAAEPATVGDSEIGVDAEGAGIAFEKDELAQVHALVLADTEDSVAPLLFRRKPRGPGISLRTRSRRIQVPGLSPSRRKLPSRRTLMLRRPLETGDW
jgi:hypothetical protein